MCPSGSRRTGRSGATPAMGSVTMYMCSQACNGTVTPLMRPSSRAQMPAQFTTMSVAMAPSEVSTPATAPARRVTPVTRIFSSTRAPPARAGGERLGDVGGIALAVAGNPHRAHQIVGAQQRIAPLRLVEADLVRLDAEAARHRGVAAELDHPLLR